MPQARPARPSAPSRTTRGALQHDDGARRRLATRLRRIEGQVRGLQRMVEEERYCPEILQQVEAVQASLSSFAETLLAGHLRHCVTSAIRSGDAARAETVYAELAELYRRSRR
jgi:DNA-binding FrmR family transcriptional regulator